MKRLSASVGSALLAFRVRPVVLVVLLLCASILTARAQNAAPPASTLPTKTSLRVKLAEVETKAAATARTIRADKTVLQSNSQSADLKALLAQAFELRQEIQNQEVEEHRQRMTLASRTVQQREQERAGILERRAGELLKNDVESWLEMAISDNVEGVQRGLDLEC